MSGREVPYGTFNFLVNFDGSDVFGGFSDVSGLSSEITMAEYRTGNELENHVRKVPGVHKVGDVTLKRGIIDSKTVWEWIKDTRTRGYAAKKDVTVILLDESRQAVQKWVLKACKPMKYTGPTLAGKGGTDVAMEELVLSVEGL
ncbi:MAG: phage tail protein, partial [Planctomycetota bacterium]|nr:phage tail protein [Planctomycetota bacterium]